MIVEIKDDFNLEKIYLSGQCFRIKKYDDGGYRFLSGGQVIYIREKEKNLFAVSCSEKEWKDIWFEYFDLRRNYRGIRHKEYGKNTLVDEAMEFGQGIRIIRQEPWETLVTFIVSQRKNIPAITKAIEMLSASYGQLIMTEYETISAFPTPEELSLATEEGLKECGLGYRAAYVSNAVDCVLHNGLDLDSLAFFSDEKLLKELQTIKGVGEKVANCVALFAYARMSSVPIDVWISRAIEEECHGCSPFFLFQKNAGIIQQYIFYYERFHK